MEKTTSTTERSQSIQELAKSIEGIRFAMFSTHGADGHIHSRPMTTQEAEFDGELWFFSSADSQVVREIEANPSVNVAYADEDKGLWVSLAGKASVLQDLAKQKELYTPMVKAYFPDGYDDPNLCLIQVEVEEAECWDTPQSKLVRVFNLVKAAVTGKRDDQGQHQKINL